MKKLIPSILIISIVSISSIGISNAFSYPNTNGKTSTQFTSNGYGIQWMMEYGTDPREDARFQGPQPIGDCDNDGKNELLISGRDCAIRVMKWDENEQNYSQVYALHPPFYPRIQCDAGGMAIGDVTNDGKNEIAATWYTAVYRYFASKYWMIGVNPWIFFNGGGSADCLIGDCDNDGKNELILSGGGDRQSSSPVGEITVFKWNGLYLKRVAEWNDPNAYGYVYMAGLGDVDDDGENEIVCAYDNKVMVLDWVAQNKTFISTRIYSALGHDTPFGV
jgi:hypothetical protein